jgi:hypothetical protein
VNAPVLLLDSTVLVAYERDLTRRAQTVALEALTDGRLMVTAALSLAVTCAELGGETRELAWLIYDRNGPLSVLPLGLGAMEIGAAAVGGGKTASDPKRPGSCKVVVFRVGTRLPSARLGSSARAGASGRRSSLGRAGTADSGVARG